MPMTSKEMIKLLESKGFVYIRANGSHRMYKNSQTNKAVTVPYHNKALKVGTEQSILKQGLNSPALYPYNIHQIYLQSYKRRFI